MLCIPSTAKTRSLIPLHPASVLTEALTRRLSGRGVQRTFRRMAVVRLVRAGLVTRGSSHVAHLVPSPESGLTELISEHLQQDIVMAVHFGAPRANQKPVLELMDRAGKAVAFGKVGVNALTDRLVRAETDALTALADRLLPHVVHPTMLARTSWQGHPLLLQSALPTTQARPAPASLVVAAAAEVAAVVDSSRCRLSANRYFAGLSSRVLSLPPGEVRDLLHDTLLALATQDGWFTFGAWHGDWTSWNMAEFSGRLIVWDWERYGSEVPAGFDLLHHAFQSAVHRDPREAPAHARNLLARAPRLLPWLDASTAEATARLYVIEIATRYLRDGQAEAGGRLGDVLPWVAAALTNPPSRPGVEARDQRRDQT